MKTVLRTLLLVGIVLVSPFIFLFAAMRSASYNAQFISQTIANSGIYEIAVKELQTNLKSAREQNDPEDPVGLIAPFLEREITPNYLKQKTDTLIQDARAWATGQTQNPPVVSFSDLKEKLMKQNSYLINQLQTMSDEFKNQKSLVEKEMAANPDAYSSQDETNVPEFDINTALRSDFSFPVGSYLWFIPLWQKMSTFGLSVLLGFFAASLLCIVLLSDSLGSRLRWIGGTLTAICLWNVVPWALVAGGSLILAQGLTTMTADVPSFVIPVIKPLTQPLVGAYVGVTGISMGALSLLGILSFLLSFVVFGSAPTTPPTKTKLSAKK